MDVGCGSGYLSQYLATQGFSTLGVDKDHRRIAAATKQGGENSMMSFRAEEFLAFTKHQSDKTFDAVIFNFSLHEQSKAVRDEWLLQAHRLSVTGVWMIDYDFSNAIGFRAKAICAIIYFDEMLISLLSEHEHYKNFKEHLKNISTSGVRVWCNKIVGLNRFF